MKNSLSLALILFLLFFSCKENSINEHGAEIINVDFDNIRDTLYYSDIFNKHEIISLEYTDNSVIGEIGNLIMYDGKYFVFDILTQTVFVFNYDGSFSHKIGRKGRGPGEFIRIENININNYDSLLYIISSRPQKIIKYNLNGDFIGEIKIDIYASAIAPFEEELWLFADSDPSKVEFDERFQLYASNISGKIIKKSLPVKEVPNYPNPTKVDYSQPFVPYKNKFIFSLLLNDKIYELNNIDIKVKYILDYGKNSINSVIFEESDNSEDLTQRILNEKYAHDLNSVFETDAYLFFKVKRENDIYNLTYNKVSKHLSHFKDDRLKLSPNVFSIKEHELIGIRSIGSLLIEEEYRIEKGEPNNIRLLIPDLSHNHNPVIVRYWKDDDLE